MEKIVIDVVDYRGKRVMFTEKKWQEKSIQHSELKLKVFLKNIEDTIKNPEEVWEDYEDKINNKSDKLCYYKKYSQNSYVKVIVWCSSNPCRIVSAFETNKIKEEKYIPNLKRIK